jgi:protein Tex
MGDPVTINLRHVARGLGIPVGQIQAVVELLDEGNTIPFITRYRKDQTGGLDEEQIRQIRSRLTKLRMLAERKETILRSIELQGKLTEKLAKQIHGAGTTKRLEDLYLPYKPKKQTLATLARSRGLETLADEIIEARPECADLDARAADYVNSDRQVPTAADALLGAGHILAERFSERAELRDRLREVLHRTGKFVSSRIGDEVKQTAEKPGPAAPKTANSAPKTAASAPKTAASAPPVVAPAESGRPSKEASEEPPPLAVVATQELAEAAPPESETPTAETPAAEPPVAEPPSSEAADPGRSEAGEANAEEIEQPQPTAADDEPTDVVPSTSSESSQSTELESEGTQKPDQQDSEDQQGSGQGGGEGDDDIPETPRSPAEQEGVAEAPEALQSPAVEQSDGQAAESVSPSESPAQDQPRVEPSSEAASQEPVQDQPPAAVSSETETPQQAPDQPRVAPSSAGGSSVDASPGPQPPSEKQAQKRPSKPFAKRPKGRRGPSKKEQSKRKARERIQKAFSDYFDYNEELKKIPPHRVLAINRGERAKVLRVKIECDLEAMYGVLDELCLPEGNPHAEFIRGCARDALMRLILPSLEREIRRDLTDRAEVHAVGVFAKNLRNLLLQPPVNNRRILAVDPGYRSGCKLVALDQFGNVLGHNVIYLVGKAERKERARQIVTELIERCKLSVVTIGNGSACREAEDFFAELIAGELKDRDLSYVIVNEAGASVYSTSRLGREEFPNYDATLRGAVSIGRRLQDPLSELVKIDPANIGVGLYQHDVKAKHLRASLDEVVESCVNYVGVDVNTASPALLRYVSGLNQLTARRVCEHRLSHGPFRNREQLMEVPGFGEATFVQAAGFLKITSGDNPLDATWIHPESYQVAAQVMMDGECDAAELANTGSLGKLAERLAKLDAAALSEKLNVGSLLFRDIISQLTRPGRDPRDDLPPPIFKRGVLKLDDLSPGMELTGTVLNVVDFGTFVDIGMHDSGLVHVSQLADKFVRDPHDFVAVGDIVKVWVVEVDKPRRRVSLTMIPPGAQRSRRPRDGKPESRPASGRPAKPRGDRKPTGKRPPHSRGKSPAAYRPKTQPKPVTPITKAMKAGREPMRSFSDLSQFLGVSKLDPVEDKKKNKKSKAKKEDLDNKKSKPQSDGQEPPALSTNDEQPPPPTSNDEEQARPPVSNDGGQTTPEGPDNQVS